VHVRNALLTLLRPIGVEGALRPIMARYVWGLPVVVVLAFVASLLEGCGISLLIPLVSTLLSTTPVNLPGPLAAVSDLMNRYPPADRLLLAGGVILGFVILKGVVQTLYGSFIGWLEGRIAHDVRCALTERTMTVGYAFHLQTSSSRMVNVLTGEVSRLGHAIRYGFMAVVAISGAAVFGVLMVVLNLKLMLAVAVGVTIIRLTQHLFVTGAHRTSDWVTAAGARLSQLMLRVIQATRLIRMYNQEAREQAGFAAASNELRRATLRADIQRAFAGSVLESSYAVLFIAVLLGSYFAGVHLPSLVAFLLLLYRSQPFLKDLTNAHLALAALRGSVREVEWLLEPAGKPLPPGGTLPIAKASAPIVFEKIGFDYEEGAREHPALQDVSFRLEPGRAIALIGRSGSGKSTVINLICRLLEPTAGRILVDGHPLSEIDPKSWRARLAFAGQDVDLIDGTLADNIAYGAAGATRDDIVEAATLADIHGFIQSLPNGYDTLTDLGGVGLSGGQRQRIGLARALIRKPDLLILDEATSAVDAVSEAAILEMLKSRGWRSTTLVVSHRVSTLSACDDGIVLAGGRVIEAGPLQGLDGWRQMMAAETA
jgi:subfamily B ATP-binding cassette protein MsbA